MRSKAKSQRSLFGKLLVFLLTILALVGLVAMVLSVLSSYISPKVFVWTSFFGLAFWEIFFFNFLILFFLVLLRSNKAWIAVIAMLVSIPGLGKSYSFGSVSKEEGSLRVMSYNVHNFAHIKGKVSKSDFVDELLVEVERQSPDVLCLQEFVSPFKQGKSRPQCIELFAQASGFPYVYYNLNRNYAGNVIFSHYPLQKVAEDTGFGKENTYGVMVLVDAGEKGKFYMANVHLLSYSITDREIDSLPYAIPNKNVEVMKSVVGKLKSAFVRRSNEINEVINGMPQTDVPIIVCGDFNEVPLSYVYQQMKKAGFQDSFLKVGTGIKPTFGGKLPLLRIDYIWTNDGVKPLRYSRIKKKLSDHYPVVLDLNIENNKIEE